MIEISIASYKHIGKDKLIFLIGIKCAFSFGKKNGNNCDHPKNLICVIKFMLIIL